MHRVGKGNIGKYIPNVTGTYQSTGAHEVSLNLITQMLLSSPWELHLSAIFSKYSGDSSRCLPCTQTQIWSLSVELYYSAGAPWLQGFWDISQPTSIVASSLCSSRCQRGRLLNDLSMLYFVTWDMRSTVDGVFRLIKAIFPACFLAPVFKNLRRWLLLKRKVSVPCHSLWSLPFFTRAESFHGYQLLQIDSWVSSTDTHRYIWIVIYAQPWPTIQSHFPCIKLS